MQNMIKWHYIITKFSLNDKTPLKYENHDNTDYLIIMLFKFSTCDSRTAECHLDSI